MRLRSKITDLLNPKIGTQGRPSKGDIVTNTPKQGTDPNYIIRRLKRDSPTLAERVIRGDLGGDCGDS